MMPFLRSIATAFSFFSCIPMPHFPWEERNLRYVFCAFPLVGIVSGLLLLGWTWLAELLGLGTFFYAAGVSLLPVLLSGGIHLDGFCDVVDALASRGDATKKRNILKDPHTGAFAVIGVCAYLLFFFALATELDRSLQTTALLALSYVLSRSLSGLLSLIYPSGQEEGMLSSFRGAAERQSSVVVLCLWLAVTAAAMLFLSFPPALVMLLLALAVLAWVWYLAQRHFGGISGDLCGYFLQLAELFMLAGLVLSERMMTL